METMQTTEGEVKVIEYFYRIIGKKNPYKMKYVTIECPFCSKHFSASIYDIRSGHTKSCGCFQIKEATKRVFKHGLKFHHLYDKVISGIDRCNNNKSVHFQYYGGRGIKWLLGDIKESIEYLETLENNEKKEYQMDRINTNGHYEKGNIRFVSRTENMANIRSNVNITYKGETKHISEWARILGINYSTIRYRLKRGLSGDELFSKDKKITRDKYSKVVFDTVMGEKLSLSEIGHIYDIPLHVLNYRHLSGVRGDDLLKPKERKRVDNTTIIQ